MIVCKHGSYETTAKFSTIDFERKARRSFRISLRCSFETLRWLELNSLLRSLTRERKFNAARFDQTPRIVVRYRISMGTFIDSVNDRPEAWSHVETVSEETRTS